MSVRVSAPDLKKSWPGGGVSGQPENPPGYAPVGPTSLHICARKKIAGRYFRVKIFSREDIFAGSYFRGKIFSREQYILLAKIFQIHFSRKFPPAKIKCYTVGPRPTADSSMFCTHMKGLGPQLNS